MTASLLTRIAHILFIIELVSMRCCGLRRLHLVQRSVNAVSLTRRHYSRIPLMPEADPVLEIDDNILTGLNGAQDLTIKVCSCTKVLQEFIDRSKIPDITAMALGELIASTVMLSSSLKDEETMQVWLFKRVKAVLSLFLNLDQLCRHTRLEKHTSSR